MSKNRKTQRQAPLPDGLIRHAADGTVIGRMDALEKQFKDVRNVIDLSEKSQAFIRAGMAGLAAERVTPQGPQPVAYSYDPSTFMGETNFSAGTPNMPINADESPRQFAYTPGTNYTWMPRSGYGILDYNTLRNLAFASKEIRLNIQKVKDTLRGLKHEVTQRDDIARAGKTKFRAIPPNADEVQSFWRKPDDIYEFDDWLDMLLEDALVCGASALFLRPLTKCAEQIDVTTWRILTTFDGRIPAHPQPAYLQVTYGRSNYWTSRKHLVHSALHPTISNPYGFSPQEFIIQAIVQSIKRDSARTGAFTDGNVPYAFVGLPSTWTPSQIQDFTDWFNATLQGDVNRSNKLMFIPHDGSNLPVAPFSAVDQNATGLDEWLLKVAAWAYGNNPSEFGLVSGGSGLGGAGFMAAGENAQFRGSTAVYTQYVSRIVERVCREYLDAPWAQSKWVGLEPPEDDKLNAEVEKMRIDSGVWSVEYVRDQLGYPSENYPDAPKQPATPPFPALPVPGAQFGQAALPQQPGQTPAPFQQQPAGPIPPQFQRTAQVAAKAELIEWRDKERFRLAKNLPRRPFRTDCIPRALVLKIDNDLQKCQTRAESDALFSEAIRQVLETPQMFKAEQPPAPERVPGRPAVLSFIEQALREIGA